MSKKKRILIIIFATVLLIWGIILVKIYPNEIPFYDRLFFIGALISVYLGAITGKDAGEQTEEGKNKLFSRYVSVRTILFALGLLCIGIILAFYLYNLLFL